MPATLGAYATRVENKGERYGSKKRRTVAELIPWNGLYAASPLPTLFIHHYYSDARPLLDSEGRIFLVLAGQPRTEDYRAMVSRAFAFLKKEGDNTAFPADMRRHRRGLFAIINVGLTFGKGQTVPTWLENKSYAALTNRLLANSDILHMASFASFCFKLWAPRLHDYYVDYNKRLSTRFLELKRPFPKSVFSCTAFNFGSKVWMFKHRNVCNLPFGLCAVQSLGNFDSQ
ncbi:hypothetical protein B0H14DRAFT_2375248 [Mycena olivaceomarginata]|nr:hypothetical protein B0H14DRAFT_2375248 [Mycena olivaceomarginata]